MAVSEFALVSLTETQDYLGLNGTDAKRDAWLEGEIQRQTARVEGWLDRKVKARFHREDLHANSDDGYTLKPKHTPILEVVNLYSDTQRQFTADTLIDADRFEVYRNRIEFVESYPFGYSTWTYADRRRQRTIRLEYVSGWGVIEVPFSRQRLDLTETAGGETLTFYLDAGVWTPKEIVEQLNIELNTAGEHRREVSFDWRRRHFTVTQADGELTLLPSINHSAFQLLGFHGTGHTSSPATGDAVALDIPADLKGAVLMLLALDYDKSAFGKHNSRGLTSLQVSTYRASYANMEDSDGLSGMPKEIEAVLDKYKHWKFV